MYKKYEVLAKLHSDEQLILWRKRWYYPYYVLTESQYDIFIHQDDYFYNGEYFDNPPHYICKKYFKRRVWKEVLEAILNAKS